MRRACTGAGTLFFTRVGLGKCVAVARLGSAVFSGISAIALEALAGNTAKGCHSARRNGCNHKHLFLAA